MCEYARVYFAWSYGTECRYFRFTAWRISDMTVHAMKFSIAISGTLHIIKTRDNLKCDEKCNKNIQVQYFYTFVLFNSPE
jgi:hypothetical protein